MWACSLAVHIEELFEMEAKETVNAIKARRFDRAAIEGLLIDEEVRDCIKALGEIGLVPKKRASR